jgi:transcriptional regulator with XRE-family HTH domain
MLVFDRHQLRKIRKLKGYSLEMTARLIQVRGGPTLSRSAISHWERGAAKPSRDSLLALADLFDVPLDYFFTRQTNYLFDNAGPGQGREP